MCGEPFATGSTTLFIQANGCDEFDGVVLGTPNIASDSLQNLIFIGDALTPSVCNPSSFQQYFGVLPNSLTVQMQKFALSWSSASVSFSG